MSWFFFFLFAMFSIEILSVSDILEQLGYEKEELIASSGLFLISSIFCYAVATGV